MLREELIFVGTCDINGHVRGKGFPARELAARKKKGVGWTQTNMMQTAFGALLDTPFGTAGDLMIVPDDEAEVRVDFGDGSASSISSSATSAIPTAARGSAARATSCAAPSPRSTRRAGLRLIAAFEQEFVYTGVEDRPAHAYSLDAWRRQGTFGESLIAALRAAGLKPDSFLPEYGAAPIRGDGRAAAGAQGSGRGRDRAGARPRGRLPPRPPRHLLADAGCRRGGQRRAHPFLPARRCRQARDL